MGCFLRGDAPSLRTDIGRGKAGDILGKVRRCKGSKGAFGKLSVGSIWWHSDSVRRDVAMVGWWIYLRFEWIIWLGGFLDDGGLPILSLLQRWFPTVGFQFDTLLCVFLFFSEAFMVRLSQIVFKTSILWHGYLVTSYLSWRFQRILEILYIVKLDHLPR